MILEGIREVYVGLAKDLTEEQLLFIPEGFANNILWNLGHVVVVQQMLTYGLAKQELNVGKDLIGLFRKGSSPKMWQDTPDISPIMSLLTDLPKKFKEDYNAGLFTEFSEYKTATGSLLRTIDDGIAFNDFHEGLHMGSILALRKLVL